jgi:proteasome accessory factor C
VLEVLRTAVRERRRVHLDYYSYGRDTRTERDVDPYLVQAEDGSLYLLAHCHLARAERRFRVDRIAAAALLDETFEPREGDLGPGLFQPDVDDPRVVLHLAPEASWVVDTYPVEAVEPADDGGQVVTMAISAEPWFARLLLNLGPQARILDAPEELRGAAGRAAERILARYR